MARRQKIKARDVFDNYLRQHHNDDIISILQDEDEEKHFAVLVNFSALFEDQVEVSESLLASSIKLLKVFDDALVSVTKSVYDNLQETNGVNLDPGLNKPICLKKHLHIRLFGFPNCPELYRHTVPRTCDGGRLLCIVGTVVRTTQVKMLEYKKMYICSKCKHTFSISADYHQYYNLVKPLKCPNPEQCYSYTFNVLNASTNPLYTKDYQEIKIQEQIQKLVMGTIPRSIWVTLEDDLVDACKPGDDVMISGTVLRRWKVTNKGTRPNFELVLKANNIIVKNKQHAGVIVSEEMKKEFKDYWEQHKTDPLIARDTILASFCPQVYGLYVVKIAVAILVAGGVQKAAEAGTRVRGESHLLLVGDPGTGKSQFLKYVTHLVPRSVLTTGIGTTNAGLTVTAVRDEGEWALEAGALVLADGGVCCIDEFNCIRECDRAAIHEAMEQQTISVAKAGLVCKLNSRCSILAATNPKGRYDTTESLNVNVALASPLLSRFDLILVLLDTRNEDWDRIVSTYILNGNNSLKKNKIDGWSTEKLQAYFSHIRTIQPRMMPHTNKILSRYYQLQRQTDQRNQVRTTIRLLESLVRLSQGHARLMMRDEVTVMDAIIAITLMEASMHGTSLITGVNPLHTSFPESPLQQYRHQVKTILEKLQLIHILQGEMSRLNDLAKHQSLAKNASNLLPPESLSRQDVFSEESPITKISESGPKECSTPLIFDVINPASQHSSEDDSKNETSKQTSKRKLTYDDSFSASQIDRLSQDLLEEFEDVSQPNVKSQVMKKKKPNYSFRSSQEETNGPQPSSNSCEISSVSKEDSDLKEVKREINSDERKSVNQVNNKSKDATKTFRETICQNGSLTKDNKFKLSRFQCTNDNVQEDNLPNTVIQNLKSKSNGTDNTHTCPPYPLTPVIICKELGTSQNKSQDSKLELKKCKETLSKSIASKTIAICNKFLSSELDDDDDFDFSL